MADDARYLKANDYKETQVVAASGVSDALLAGWKIVDQFQDDLVVTEEDHVPHAGSGYNTQMVEGARYVDASIGRVAVTVVRGRYTVARRTFFLLGRDEESHYVEAQQHLAHATTELNSVRSHRDTLLHDLDQLKATLEKVRSARETTESKLARLEASIRAVGGDPTVLDPMGRLGHRGDRG